MFRSENARWILILLFSTRYSAKKQSTVVVWTKFQAGQFFQTQGSHAQSIFANESHLGMQGMSCSAPFALQKCIVA